MPSPPNAPSCIRVTFGFFVGADASAQSSFYMEYAGGAPNSASLNDWCVAAVAEWNGLLKAMSGSWVELVSITARDLSSSTGAEGAASAAITGTRAGGELPAGTAALLNFRVARRYRGGKPRMYLPQGTDTDLESPQSWTSAFQTAAETAWTSYMAWAIANPPVGTSSWQQVNVSLFQGVNPPTTLPSGRVKQTSKYRAAAVIDVITSSSYSAKVASQRRRNLN